MFYILIDKEIPLSTISSIPNTQVSLLVNGPLSRVMLRYKNTPFSTNIPIEENVTIANAYTGGMINGDFKGIQLYADDTQYTTVDDLMNVLQDNKIMAMMMKV